MNHFAAWWEAYIYWDFQEYVNEFVKYFNSLAPGESGSNLNM